MSEARIIVGEHLRAKADGRVVLRLSGSGAATVTLRSAWPIPPRWLGGASPRRVRFGKREVDLRPDADTTVILRLSGDHLALLHRMQSIRATIRLQTHEGVLTRRVSLHSPACKRSRDQGRGRPSRVAVLDPRHRAPPGARTRHGVSSRA